MNECPYGIKNEKDIERLGDRVTIMFEHLSEGFEKLDKKLDLTPTEELRPLLEYIQALRDVPQQEGFPNNITWPEVPDDRQL